MKSNEKDLKPQSTYELIRERLKSLPTLDIDHNLMETKMKLIPKKDLRKLITKLCDDDVSLDDIKEIFECYGNDY